MNSTTAIDPPASSVALPSAIDELLLSEYSDWAVNLTLRTTSPFIALGSHRKTGKSTLFRLLADAQPHLDEIHGEMGVTWVYWDLESDTRARTFQGFWRSLGGFAQNPDLFTDILEGESSPSDDALHTALDLWAEVIGEGVSRPVLVLDHWTEARHGGGQPRVNVNALQLLTDAIVVRSQNLSGGALPVGMVIPTGFPTVDMLLHWARGLGDQSLGLYRLSGTIDRQFEALPMPFLRHQTSIEICKSLGLSKRQAGGISAYTGDWFGPLIYATRMSVNAETSKEAFDYQREVLPYVRNLLKSVLEYYAASEPDQGVELNETQIQSRALATMVRDVELDRKSTRALGIPVALSDSGSKPAGVVYDLFAESRYLVVDVENLALRFKGKDQKGLSIGVREALIESHLWERISEIAHAYSVPEGPCIVLAARNERRIVHLFGDPPENWTIRCPGRTKKQERELGGSADDTAAAVFMAEKATLNPAAIFFILSGDIDHIANIADHHSRSEFHLLCPWEIGSGQKADIERRSNCAWKEGVLVRTKGSTGGPFPRNVPELLQTRSKEGVR